MPNQIQIFQFESQSIPTVIENGEAYFAVNELAQVLGFSNPRQAINSHVAKEDVQKFDTLTQGGNQKKSFVNESGMYALVFGSSKPEAKRFKKWVTSEVLPSIRKNGNYQLKPVTPEIPQTLPEALPNKSATTVDKKQTICFTDVRGLKTLKASGQNRPDSKADFFMPKISNFLCCEGEEYNTRKGNNSDHLALVFEPRGALLNGNLLKNEKSKEAHNA